MWWLMTFSEIVFPELFRSTEEHVLLVETAAGSTVTFDTTRRGRIVGEFTGIGAFSQPGLGPDIAYLVVKSGAILTSEANVEAIYVEAGGVAHIPYSFASDMPFIFAEDGATIDTSAYECGFWRRE